MRTALLIAAAALAVPSVASAQSVEQGVPRGSLAVAAIERGDLAAAERRLADSQLDATNPSRLINTAYLRWQQGRRAEALALWQQVADSPRREMVETLSGREVRTDRLARDILVRVSQTAGR